MDSLLQKLVQFLQAVQDDPRIGTAHIAVYAALFELWCKNEGKDPVSFTRGEVMKGAKIQSRSTYHNCMRVLHDYGYIRYTLASPGVGEYGFPGGWLGRSVIYKIDYQPYAGALEANFQIKGSIFFLSLCKYVKSPSIRQF